MVKTGSPNFNNLDIEGIFTYLLSETRVAIHSNETSETGRDMADAFKAQTRVLSFSVQQPDMERCIKLERHCMIDAMKSAREGREMRLLDEKLSDSNMVLKFVDIFMQDKETYCKHVEEGKAPHRVIMFPPSEPYGNFVKKQSQYLATLKHSDITKEEKEMLDLRQLNLQAGLGKFVEKQCEYLEIPVPRQFQEKELQKKMDKGIGKGLGLER